MDFLKRNIPLVVACTLVVLVLIGYRVLFAAPASFSEDIVVHIARGASAPLIAKQLADAHIIARPSVLRLALRVSGNSDSVYAGTYRFETSQNLFTVMHRLVTGAYGFPPVRVTFTEGKTVREMASQITNMFPDVETKDFLREAKPYEGYLFPDTYFFLPSTDAASILATLRENFNTKTASLTDKVYASGYSLSDIVILASLVEKEARTSVSRRIVAGVLFNRLKLGMPLQVDAVFGYIFDRDTYSPSFADLTVDSPYNTYTHKGLPPGPINNPGLDSLEAVLNPTKTNYLYYLTGKDDLMHYATTYAGHQANRKKYLD